MRFQHPHLKNIKFNPYNLPITRPQRIIDSRYGLLFDGGLEIRGTVPMQDPWFGLLRNQLWTWDQKNLELMLNGQPPWGHDGQKVQLHHRNNQPNGPLDEYSFTEHKEQHGILHDPDAALIDQAIGSFPSRADYDQDVWAVVVQSGEASERL